MKKRIEAHICISFATCKLYKELERQLKLKQSSQSQEQVIDILKTLYQITFTTPYSSNIYLKLILKTDEQKLVVKLFNLEF